MEEISYKLNLTLHTSNIKPVEVVEDIEKVVNENIGPAGGWSNILKMTFPGVNYTIRHKKY